MGESFGVYRIGADDEKLLELVSSANVACGFHAGDPMVMQRTVSAAAGRGVTIGAHPGYRDLPGFGRRELAASPTEIAADVVYLWPVREYVDVLAYPPPWPWWGYW